MKEFWRLVAASVVFLGLLYGMSACTNTNSNPGGVATGQNESKSTPKPASSAGKGKLKSKIHTTATCDELSPSDFTNSNGWKLTGSFTITNGYDLPAKVKFTVIFNRAGSVPLTFSRTVMVPAHAKRKTYQLSKKGVSTNTINAIEANDPREWCHTAAAVV